MAKLIFLPGVGADGRLFEPQREAFPDLLVPDWLPPEPEESLPHYASRMAEAMKPLFTDDGPILLGGVSFGGMVAYEAARVLKPAAVIQIASCRSRRAVRGLLRVMSPLASAALPSVLGAAKMMSPVGLELLTHMKTKERNYFVAMFRESDSTFITWALTSILNWEPSSPPEAPVRQIHGRRDLLLSVENIEADEIVPTGGHLINMTHRSEVNAFIRKVVDSAVAQYRPPTT